VGSVDARKAIAQYTNQQTHTFRQYFVSQQQNHTKGASSSSQTASSAESCTCILEEVTTSRKVSEDDVIIASGCSGAVELAISVLLDPGDNILVPW
jgi:DNA-binding transcriptional MocR family regulator